MRVLWLCVFALLCVNCLYAAHYAPWGTKSTKLSSAEMKKMREHVKHQFAKDEEITITSTTTVTTTTTPQPTTATPETGLTSYFKCKFQRIRNWCTNCFVKAGKVLKDVLGLDKSDEEVYRTENNTSKID